ncbi:hypothetical protein ACLOJK_023362, partial [Asimina triloba]
GGAVEFSVKITYGSYGPVEGQVRSILTAHYRSVVAAEDAGSVGQSVLVARHYTCHGSTDDTYPSFLAYAQPLLTSRT